MPSCRSRKTGTCSDWSKNKRLPQKISETASGLFLFSDRLPLRLTDWHSLYPGKGVTPQK